MIISAFTNLNFSEKLKKIKNFFIINITYFSKLYVSINEIFKFAIFQSRLKTNFIFYIKNISLILYLHKFIQLYFF